jgi:hypothetical protein
MPKNGDELPRKSAGLFVLTKLGYNENIAGTEKWSIQNFGQNVNLFDITFYKI